MTQDVFPKVAGDILYNSEINYAIRGGGLGNFIWKAVNSGTDWQDTGSINIPSGSICRDNSLIIVQYITARGANNTPAKTIHRLIFSGIINNFIFLAGSSDDPQSTQAAMGIANLSLDNGSLTQGTCFYTYNNGRGVFASNVDAFQVFTPSGTWEIISQSLTNNNMTNSGIVNIYSSPMTSNY